MFQRGLSRLDIVYILLGEDLLGGVFMHSIAVSKDFSGARLWLRASVLILSVLISFFTIYVVGLEPMVYLHDTFHDIRHSTGFPCH